MYERLSIEMNFTEKNKRLHKFQLLFIKSIKINQIKICQYYDFWVIHSLRVKLRMYVTHEETWFLINILIKSLETNLNVVSEKKDFKIIQWDHENQLLCYDSHHIIVLTISDSYDAHVASHIQHEIELIIINHWEKIIRKVIIWCNIIWEIIYRDEFHRKKQETAQTSTLIHQINQN